MRHSVHSLGLNYYTRQTSAKKTLNTSHDSKDINICVTDGNVFGFAQHAVE